MVTACSSSSAASAPATGKLADSDVRKGDAPGDAIVHVGLGLERDQQGLADYAKSVSSPGSDRYRQFLTHDEIADRFGAPRSRADAVADDLEGRGLKASVDATRSFVTATGTVKDVAAAFETSLASYRSQSGLEYLSNDSTATVPGKIADDVAELTGLVATVKAPTTDVDVEASSGGGSGTPAGCSAAVTTGAITPPQLADAYGISKLQAAGLDGAGRRVAVLEVSGYEQASTDGFAQCFGLPSITPTIHRVAGNKDAIPPAGIETAMDVELLLATAPNLERLDIFELDASLGPVFALAQILDPDNTGGRAPDVFSTSVVFCEGSITQDHAKLLEHLLAAAAAMGVTSVAAAGDHGSAGCFPPDRAEAVQYPASSEFVTAVGGTSVELSSANEVTKEVVWNNTDAGDSQSAGGGGSSDLIDSPWYQIHLDYGDRRALPDIALFADSHVGISVYYCSPSGDCGWGAFAGTSAATPIAAGGFALLDQQAAARSQPNLGFVNPLLYDLSTGTGDALRDVTSGNNALFGNRCCDAGSGHDQASGLGSIDFSALADDAEKPSGGRTGRAP